MLFPSLANNPNKNPNIGFTEKFAYGLGDFASQMLYTPTGALLIYYYTQCVNVNMAVVATIMFLSRFFDGFSDLIVGYLIERTETPYGKARVWIIRMLLPFFIAMVALFTVPDGSDIFKYIYIFVSYNFAITVVYTAINLPYGAMSTMMTKDSYQRSIIVIYRMLLATAGNTFVMIVTLPLVKFLGGEDSQMAWTLAFVILAGIATLGFFITFAFCHERVPSSPADQLKGKTLQAVKGLFRNKYWIMTTLAMLTIFSADVVFGTANTYYCKFFLNNSDHVGTFATIMNVVKVLSMIFLLPILLRTKGKRFALLIACSIILVSLFPRMIDPYNATIAFVASGFYGFGQGFTYACLFAMIPDTVEYGEYIEHERHEGLVYAGASFGTKVAAGLGAVLASFVMNYYGYDNSAEVQTAAAMDSILYSTTITPAILYILGILSVVGYGLDKEYPAIIKELNQRHVNDQKDLPLNLPTDKA